MSAIAESLRRQRLPLLTIAVLLLLGTIAWVYLARTTSEHLTQPDYPVAAPAIEQADWRFDYTEARRYGKLSKAEQARYAEQKQKATALVQDLYDGIFLEPARLKDVVKDSFTADASKSFKTDHLGFPSGANDVRTLKRTAQLALDAVTARSAIGRVTVLAQADMDDRVVKIEHRSTLWLERSDKGWQVIAFEVEQGPAK